MKEILGSASRLVCTFIICYVLFRWKGENTEKIFGKPSDMNENKFRFLLVTPQIITQNTFLTSHLLQYYLVYEFIFVTVRDTNEFRI